MQIFNCAVLTNGQLEAQVSRLTTGCVLLLCERGTSPHSAPIVLHAPLSAFGRLARAAEAFNAAMADEPAAETAPPLDIAAIEARHRLTRANAALQGVE